MLLAAAVGVAGFEPAWVALAVLAAAQALFVATAKEWRGGAELRLGCQIEDSR